MTRPNKLQLTHDEIELTNSDIQDMPLDMGFKEYELPKFKATSLAHLPSVIRNSAMLVLRLLSKR
jgi:hypothetical protein